MPDKYKNNSNRGGNQRQEPESGYGRNTGNNYRGQEGKDDAHDFIRDTGRDESDRAEYREAGDYRGKRGDEHNRGQEGNREHDNDNPINGYNRYQETHTRQGDDRPGSSNGGRYGRETEENYDDTRGNRRSYGGDQGSHPDDASEGRNLSDRFNRGTLHWKGRDGDRDRPDNAGGSDFSSREYGRNEARAQGSNRGGNRTQDDYRSLDRNVNLGGDQSIRQNTRERDYGGMSYGRDSMNRAEGREGNRGGKGGEGANPYSGSGQGTSLGWGYDKTDGQGRSQEGPHAGKGPKGYSRSPERIKEEICARLHDHSHLDASDISVKVENGEVTLEGTVENRRAKRLAEDALEGIKGVRDVHNHLRVQGQQNDTRKDTQES